MLSQAYVEYLQSAEWKAKSARVLKRDKYLCQNCLAATATDAHHTTYRHVFNEPLFDLVALCRPCHEEITLIERAARVSG